VYKKVNYKEMMLFKPYKIRHMELKNRLVSTPAVHSLATEDGYVTDDLIKRFIRMARGGIGWLQTEDAVVTPRPSPCNLRISDDRFIDGLRRLTDAIRNAAPNVKIGIQLGHFLKASKRGYIQKVEEVTREEIKEFIEQHNSAARRIKQCGFDSIEHDFESCMTPPRFLSRKNMRTDEYGSTFENRMRLPLEIFDTAREILGPDVILGERIQGSDLCRGGSTELHASQFAIELARRGVDYISVSAGGQYEDHVPSPYGNPPWAYTGYSGLRCWPRAWDADGANAYLAEAVRKALRRAGYQTPVICAGKIPTAEFAEEILKEGKADLIGMFRPFLCDPDWANKYLEGREDDIVRCCYCNNCADLNGLKDVPTNCAKWQKWGNHPPGSFLLVPPCKGGCPAGLDVEGYIKLVTQGFYKDALNLIEKKIPLPAVISRVCPRPCETKCNRKEIDQPIAINALKRFVVEEVEKRWGKEEITPVPRTKREKVAIIGSGPAGLTAAYDLVRNGYGVTIFEALPIPGGMPAVGIPEYRLPKKVLQTEIGDIRKLGVEIKLNSPVGKNGLTLDSLRKKGYKAIFIAVGAHKSLKLDVPGEDMEGVYHGTSFLHDVNTGKKVKVGKRVAIIGGGNVAVDAARTALRLGAKEVFIVYRRSRQEMPAHDDEIKAAEEEGVKIHYLASPVKILGKDGKIVGIECIRMELGEPDASGRRRPIPIKGSEFVIDSDMVIPAIGEVPNLDFLHDSLKTSEGTLKVDPDNLTTGVPGVFAGGDAVTGPATVIEAIAAGHKAATSIDRYLRGESLEYKKELPRIIDIDDVDTESIEGFKKKDRESMPTLPIQERVLGFKEVEFGFNERIALAEANRCLQCGDHPKRAEILKERLGY